jgi:hypothetical protein
MSRDVRDGVHDPDDAGEHSEHGSQRHEHAAGWQRALAERFHRAGGAARAAVSA